MLRLHFWYKGVKALLKYSFLIFWAVFVFVCSYNIASAYDSYTRDPDTAPNAVLPPPVNIYFTTTITQSWIDYCVSSGVSTSTGTSVIGLFISQQDAADYMLLDGIVFDSLITDGYVWTNTLTEVPTGTKAFGLHFGCTAELLVEDKGYDNGVQSYGNPFVGIENIEFAYFPDFLFEVEGEPEPEPPQAFGTTTLPMRFATSSCVDYGSTTQCVWGYQPEMYFHDWLVLALLFFFIWVAFM